MVPLLYANQLNAARLSHCGGSLGYLRHLFSKDTTQPVWTKLQQYRRASWAIRSRAGHRRWLSWAYPVLQLPSFLVLMLSIRQILAKDPAMASAGLLWFETLTM